MIGTKQKIEIAFLVVVSFLDATKLYQDVEIDEFIARNVKSEILQRRGYSIDHLRRAMVDNGFLQRQSDGLLQSTVQPDSDFAALPQEALVAKLLAKAAGSIL